MGRAKSFSTLDIYLSAFLSLHQVDPILEIRNGKVVFTFEATDAVYRLMNDFNDNKPIEVADYATAIKTLRGKMLTAKGTGNVKGNVQNEQEKKSR